MDMQERDIERDENLMGQPKVDRPRLIISSNFINRQYSGAV